MLRPILLLILFIKDEENCERITEKIKLMIYDYQANQHTWVERGKCKQQIIKTFGKAQGV